MALNKKRGRKPNASTVRTNDALKKERHWVDCECGRDGAMVDGDVDKLTCAYCVQIAVGPPKLAKVATPEEKAAKAARKAERVARQEAIAKGELMPEKKTNFGRGWHRKAAFSAEVDGKMLYFSFGKEVTKSAYNKVIKTRAAKVDAKSKPSAGWGRGWHLKKRFVTPAGDVYESGSLVSRASDEPTEKELAQLMEQV